MKLSRKELLALGIIVGAILIVNIGFFVYRQSHEDTRILASAEQATADSAARGYQYGGRGYQYGDNNAEAPAARLFFFDPNTADSSTFIALGLRPNTARAIVHYRMAGGHFREPDDFARIYTLSHEDFLRLRPYIRIARQYSVRAAARPTYRRYEARENTSPATDSEYYSSRDASNSSKVTNKSSIAANYSSKGYIHKLRQGEKVDLSTADTTDLQRIPGIGPYYAAKIIRYRNRMGGFISTDQLNEVYGLPDDICRWVCVGKPQINKMKINSMTFGQLLRHPYLNFEQVKAILNHRQIYGPVRSFNDLRTYGAFCEDDFRRLAPYVDFD